MQPVATTQNLTLETLEKLIKKFEKKTFFTAFNFSLIIETSLMRSQVLEDFL